MCVKYKDRKKNKKRKENLFLMKSIKKFNTIDNDDDSGNQNNNDNDDDAKGMIILYVFLKIFPRNSHFFFVIFFINIYCLNIKHRSEHNKKILQHSNLFLFLLKVFHHKRYKKRANILFISK